MIRRLIPYFFVVIIGAIILAVVLTPTYSIPHQPNYGTVQPGQCDPDRFVSSGAYNAQCGN